jgi:hypothetical protein
MCLDTSCVRRYREVMNTDDRRMAEGKSVGDPPTIQKMRARHDEDNFHKERVIE